MFGVKKNLFLGIDIGFSNAKIVLLKKEKEGRMRLIRAFCEEYKISPQSNIQDQFFAVSSAIEKIFKEHKYLQKAMAGISIAGQTAFIRSINIPFTIPRKLHQIVKFEMQQQVPFPIKEVVWDYQLYEKGQNEMTVLLAAVKKELITSLLQLEEHCSLNIEFVDVSNLALFNCLQYFSRDLDRNLIIDCGAKTTNIILVNSGKIWTRSLPMGGDDITEAIARRLKMDFASAETVKKEKGKVLMLYYGKKNQAESQEEQVCEAITLVLTDLANEIIKTINFYKAQNKSALEIKKALITGGVSATQNITSFFEYSLSMPAEKIDYFTFLNSNNPPDASLNEFIGPALGLALRGAGRYSLNINLLPEEELKIRRFRKKIPFIISSMLALLLILLIQNAWILNKKNLKQIYLERLKKVYLQSKKNKKSLNVVQEEISRSAGQLKYLSGIMSGRYDAYYAVSTVARVMPNAVWLEKLDFDRDENKITLTGNCNRGLNDIGLFQEKLKESPLVNAVEIKTIGRTKDGIITFVMDIYLNSEGKNK